MSNFYNQASWVLVPSGIEEDIVFAQKPISGLGDLTFTRASDATYTDASGVVRRSPYNLFTQSVWTGGGALPTGWSYSFNTGTSTPLTSINGSVSYSFTTSSTRQVFNQTYSFLAGNSYTASVYVESVDGNIQVQQIIYFNNGGGTRTYFKDGLPINATENVVAGSRYSSTIVTSTTESQQVRIGNGCVGNTTRTIVLSRPQFVEGTSALDYFPTTNRQDVPRIDFRNADGTLSSCGRLLLEPQRTNSIRNSSMVGAVAGSPGTLPTNWAETLGGLTRSIVAVGTESGLPYIDFRFSGTATSVLLRVQLEAVNAIAATNGQTWSESFYLKSISGTVPQSNARITLRDSATSLLGSIASGNITATSTLSRYTLTGTLANASVAFVQPEIQIILVNGQTYDFTIRIAAPQMELGGNVSTWIPTTTAATTRTADSASKSGVSSLIGQTEGTFFTEIQITPGVSRALFSIDIGTTTNYILVSINASAQVLFRVNQASTLTTLVTSSALTLGRHKLAFAYKAGQYALYIDGVQSGVSASTSYPVGTLSQIVLNSASYGQFGDGYAEAILYPTRLDNATLAQMTTL